MHARSTKRIRVRVRIRAAVAAVATVLVAGLLPAQAGAAPSRVLSLRVAQSRDAVLDYWTEGRMENARPADVSPGADSDPDAPPDLRSASPTSTGIPQTFEGTAPSGDVTPRATEQPSVPTEGKVFFSGSDGFDYMCSGTAVVSENESMVWTAGHCVHGGKGQTYHHNWVFIPGYDDGEAPFGIWTAESLSTPEPWANRSSLKYDVGAAVVATLDGVTLGDTVGMAGIAFNQPADQDWTSLGYPAGRPFDGEDLYACHSPTLGRHDPGRIAGKRTIYIRCDMNGGSSGGGWFFTADGHSYVGSVNSYGIRGHRDWMFGPYQGRAALALYNAASTL